MQEYTIFSVGAIPATGRQIGQKKLKELYSYCQVTLKAKMTIPDLKRYPYNLYLTNK